MLDSGKYWGSSVETRHLSESEEVSHVQKSGARGMWRQDLEPDIACQEL
jgi:hypothetical protein